jgi:Uma2 family endonuclease
LQELIAMPITLSPPRLVTADEFIANEEWEKFTDLIEGEIVPMSPAGKKHNRVASRFESLFRLYCEGSERRLDYGGDGDGFLIQRDPDTLLSPDASLYRYRDNTLDGTWMAFAPEIVVEVLSPSNSKAGIALKKRKYFAAGAEQVWIADVEKATLEIHFRDGRRLTATDGAEVECEGVAEGLVVKLSEIFAPI